MHNYIAIHVKDTFTLLILISFMFASLYNFLGWLDKSIMHRVIVTQTPWNSENHDLFIFKIPRNIWLPLRQSSNVKVSLKACHYPRSFWHQNKTITITRYCWNEWKVKNSHKSLQLKDEVRDIIFRYWYATHSKCCCDLRTTNKDTCITYIKTS
jgi:hypothetical protein